MKAPTAEALRAERLAEKGNTPCLVQLCDLLRSPRPCGKVILLLEADA